MVVVDDDRDVAELLQVILIDEGFAVSCIYDTDELALKAAIERIQPACVILDGGTPASYGPSWDIARWLSSRERAIPAVMFTSHLSDAEEAMVGATDRAKSARFSAVIKKPFDIDHLVSVIRNTIGDTSPLLSESQETARLTELLDRLRSAGATEVRTSQLGREWATFQAGPAGNIFKIYRWRAADVFFVGQYSREGAELRPLAQLASVDALVAYCLRAIERSS